MSGTIDRRNFLKMVGLGGAGAAVTGCDLPSTVTLEEGKEEVVSYLAPEEYVIPGVGVWFASTCAQCNAGCGIHGRVREGRVLKLEGNPGATINNGNLCMMGQSGVQAHYNPDRIKQPMMRKGGELSVVSWDEALSAIQQKVSSVSGDRIAWFTNTLSGHQATLVSNYLDSLKSKNHYQHEVINTAVWQTVNQDMLGEAMPRLRLDKAALVVSFGADFLGTWVSPVHFAGEYAKFRKQSRRGMLVQIEPKMSLTGGSADLWLASKPGSDGQVALAIANELVNKHGKNISDLPEDVKTLVNKYDAATASQASGIAKEKIEKVAKLLAERSPSLVLAGLPVESQPNGYASTAAVMLLNHILGNVGKTIEATGTFPFSQLRSKQGSTKDLFAFEQAAKNKQLDAVFFYGTNPVYSAPAAMGLADAINNIPFKVALSMFEDETTMAADVVLPLASYLEDWGTHVASYRPAQAQISMQQPLMEKLYAETRGFGDIVLSLLKATKKDEYASFEDYYDYLNKAHKALPAQMKQGAKSEKEAWQMALQQGVIPVTANASTLVSRAISFTDPGEGLPSGAGNYYLVPSPRLGLWDGRHANLPWLQEAPDQISKVVWDSWAEMHPTTAMKLGISQGSIVNVQTEHGELKLKVVLLKGVHPEVIAIPMGQGHTAYGRYAKNRGVNPISILNPAKEEKTGELAMFATKANVSNTNKNETVVRLGASDTQHGRRFVVTMPVEQYQRSEDV